MNTTIEGHIRHATRSGILTFLFISSLSFLLCAREWNMKYAMTREAFKGGPIREELKRS
jgi:hypothetical protein